MSEDPIVIAGMARTPIGNLQGGLAPLAAHELGSHAIRAALADAGIQGEAVDQLYMGCVLPAGQGQAPARQAALNAELPQTVNCATINKVCGSGLQTAMYAHDAITAGTADVFIAGGMESMTNAPYLLTKARGGYRMGHGQIYDHMMLDGLEDAWGQRAMGTFAEQTAEEYAFSREAQDSFAIESVNRAADAIKAGRFEREITPVTYATRKGEVTVDTDEGPGAARPDKIPELKPAFKKDGTVTAGSSSSISDGAAAVVLMRRSQAEKLGATPLAVVRGHATFSREPERFTLAPVGAISKLLERTGWSAGDVDLYEINEAFAVVTMAAMRDLDLPHDKVNVHGGACVLGHPIGCSGTRLLVTLLSALEQYDLNKGVASLCIGGGEGVAFGVERL